MGGNLPGGGGNDPEMEKKLKEAQEEMERNQKMLEEMEKSWEEKLAKANAEDAEQDAKKKAEDEARASGRPQLMNLHADGMLDRKIFFDLSKITTCSAGRRQADQAQNPNIVLGGVGVQDKHACFETTDKGTTIKALSKEACAHIYVNGVALKDVKPVTLKPNDRIIFGTASAFLFRN